MESNYVFAPSIKALYNLLRQAYEKEMDSRNLMYGWVLAFLCRREEADTYQKDVEAYFSIGRSTATTILQAMEREGLLERVGVPSDGRLKKLVLTPKGWTQSVVYEKEYLAVEEKAFAGFSPAQKVQFIASMDKIQENLRRS